MCLPSILDVAGDANLIANPRTLNKKEVYYKCPFCLSDANLPKKFYLSLNPEYNVFKCWICKESGGVIDFESRLTGVPFNEVKSKYFSKKSKRHPVEYLSPKQLKMIGWNDLKRLNREAFNKEREQVLLDWKEYEQDEMIKHFSLFMVIAHLEGQPERQTDLLAFLHQSATDTGIPNLFSKLMNEYIKDEDDREEWTSESIQIARAAWKVSLETLDFDMHNVVLNTIFMSYLHKTESSKKIKDTYNQKSS